MTPVSGFGQVFGSKRTVSSIESGQNVKKQKNVRSQSQNSKGHIIFDNLSKSSLEVYNHILSPSHNTHRSLEQLSSILQKHEISFNQNYYRQFKNPVSNQQIVINSINHTKYYQIVTLNLSLGPFTQNLHIYHSFAHSPFSQKQLLYFGKYTKIWRFKTNKKNYIAKSTSFYNRTQFPFSIPRPEFLKTLKQFFITKILSVLQIGPKISDQFGFDIFLSENNAFFFLEHCKNQKDHIFTEKDSLALKRSLKEMHELCILHRDIKPDNIMFSPSYGKFVFIDFGISEYRKVHLGQLVFTNFSGTYAYCTSEMKKLFKNRERSWINLHLNDAHGLDLSIKQMENPFVKKPEAQKKQDSQNLNENLKQFLTQVQIKYVLYMGENQSKMGVKKIDRFPHEMSHRIMEFLYEIPVSNHVRKIYENFIEQYLKGQNSFMDLRQILENKNFEEDTQINRQFLTIEEMEKIEEIKEFYQDLAYGEFGNEESPGISKSEDDFTVFECNKKNGMRLPPFMQIRSEGILDDNGGIYDLGEDFSGVQGDENNGEEYMSLMREKL